MAVYRGRHGQDDQFVGGRSGDRFVFAAADLTDADTIVGGTGLGVDMLVLNGAGSVSQSQLSGVSQIERILLGDGGMAITLPPSLPASADGSTLSVVGGDGNDTIAVGGGAIATNTHLSLAGGGGDDVIFADGASEAVGGAGFDTLSFARDVATLDINLAHKSDQLLSGETIARGFEGVDLHAIDYDLAIVRGTTGANTFLLGHGEAHIYAAAGDDLFDVGYFAQGKLTGGDGADTFALKTITVGPRSADLSIDFQPGVDHLQFALDELNLHGDRFGSRVVFKNPGDDIMFADLVIYTAGPLNDANEVQAALGAAPRFDFQKDWFVVATDNQGHADLYCHAYGVFGTQTNFFKLADLGAVDPRSIHLSDFVLT